MKPSVWVLSAAGHPPSFESPQNDKLCLARRYGAGQIFGPTSVENHEVRPADEWSKLKVGPGWGRPKRNGPTEDPTVPSREFLAGFKKFSGPPKRSDS